MGKRAKHAHESEVFTLRVVTRRHVGRLHAGAHERTEITQVLVTGRAARAAAAGWDKPEHDMVADFEPRHAGADLGDNASAFVTTDDRQFERQVAGDEVLIGVTQARRSELDHDLALLRIVEFDVFHAPRCVDFPENCGLCLHLRDCRPHQRLAQIRSSRPARRLNKLRDTPRA